MWYREGIYGDEYTPATEGFALPFFGTREVSIDTEEAIKYLGIIRSGKINWQSIIEPEGATINVDISLGGEYETMANGDDIVVNGQTPSNDTPLIIRQRFLGQLIELFPELRFELTELIVTLSSKPMKAELLRVGEKVSWNEEVSP